MKAYAKENIRNVTIAGHGARGKTTLAEAMLYIAGASDRLGRVADGNTVLDFDAEEKREKYQFLPLWLVSNGGAERLI